MKKVLILSSNKQDGKKPSYLSDQIFFKKLRASIGDEIHIDFAILPELIYQVDSKVQIWHEEYGDISKYDAVIIRKVGKYLELGIAVAHYLSYKKIPFTDGYLLTDGGGKLACSFIRKINGLPVPQTYSGPAELLIKHKLIKFPCILKADLGHAGQDNYLVNNAKEYKLLLKKHKNQVMVTQKFIENEGDYRVLVLGFKPVMVILRQRQSDSHLNNTSQGGKATVIDLKDLSNEMLDTAVRAAKLEKLQVAGVDLMIDKKTNQAVIIEVNRAPQIPSGTYTDEKIEKYADFIQDFLINSRPKRLNHIGRVEDVYLKDITNNVVKARVDTGAKTSAISATTRVTDDGHLAVKFLLDSASAKKEHLFNEYTMANVASSNGQVELRYKVRIKIQIAGRLVYGTFSLTDRRSQVYPILIGRNILLHKFIVDVSDGKIDKTKENQRSKELQRGL